MSYKRKSVQKKFKIWIVYDFTLEEVVENVSFKQIEKTVNWLKIILKVFFLRRCKEFSGLYQEIWICCQNFPFLPPKKSSARCFLVLVCLAGGGRRGEVASLHGVREVGGG